MNQLTQYDLRCGNILNYLTSEGQWLPSIIDWQDIKWISEDPNGFNKVHKPIPLTEEWLLKFGFSGKDNFTDLNLKTNNLSFYCGNNDLTIVDFEFGHAVSLKVEYVHKLQNIYYSLTKLELNP